MDIRQFFRFTRLTFVKKVHESGDIYTLYFKAKKRIKHIAGQHALFFLPSGNVRIFSLASAPHEQYVKIGTHLETGSRYKNTLKSLQLGDVVFLAGPVLNFVLPKRAKKVVFLAQGIGITPFRSMLLANYEAKKPLHATLVHVAGKDHPYRKDTQIWASEAFFPTNPQEFDAIMAKTLAGKNSATVFYLSGAPSFIEATRAKLLAAGITGNHIKKDGFLGY